MGCTNSHLDPEEEGRSFPAGVRRVRDQRRRNGRPRHKGSYLRRDSEDIGDRFPSQKPVRRPVGYRRALVDHSPPPPPSAQESETKRKWLSAGPEIAGEGRGRKGEDGEELPGSPSFRIYFEGSWEDKFAADASEEGNDLENAEEKKGDSTEETGIHSCA